MAQNWTGVGETENASTEDASTGGGSGIHKYGKHKYEYIFVSRDNNTTNIGY